MADVGTALRKIALKLGDVDEGVACAGTAIESRTYKTRNKAFLFVNAKHARLKLSSSLAQAASAAKRDPAHYDAGSGGWVRVTIDDAGAVDLALLERWISESYALMSGGPPAPKKQSAGKAKKAKQRAQPATKKTRAKARAR